MREARYSTARRRPGLAAFMIGGLIGGVVALLYAPRSGQETREFLISEGQEKAEQFKMSVREASESFLARFEESQSRVESINRETRRRLKEFEETARLMVEEDRRNIALRATDTTDLPSD
jgi:gas vesicle protein